VDLHRILRSATIVAIFVFQGYTMSDTPHKNRLAQEKSPYLLQHANNPVDWYPWSDEAFKKAREENNQFFFQSDIQLVIGVM
jgi:hypothetical protein